MIETQITNIGDPFVYRVGDVYYMVATSAPDGFLCYKSKNLVDWTKIGYCYRNSPWAENCFWAPEVYFRRGKYYMFYTARKAKNHSLRIGVAVSDSPEGEFKDLTDGPLFDLSYAAIDATLLSDDDGKEYIYFARDCSENIINGVHTSQIYVAEIAPDYKSLLTEPVMVTTPDLPYETSHDKNWQWNEGPVLLKENGKYYLNYSVNCFDCADYCVGCAVADSPTGPFRKYEAPVLVKAENFSGPGHNSFFYSKEGKLMTAFHIHTDPEKPSGNRRACIAEAEITADGKFHIIL